MKFDEVVEVLKSHNEEQAESWNATISRAEKWVQAYTMLYDLAEDESYELTGVHNHAITALDELGAMLTRPTFSELKDFLGSAREAEREYTRIHTAEERQTARKLYHSLRKEMASRKLEGKLYPPELEGTFVE